MGLTPDPRGLLPEADVKRLKEWGATIKKTFSKPVASTAAKGDQILLTLNSPQTISNIVIQEEIAKGQRIRGYNIQAFIKGKWKIIAQGESIGHKRIHQIQPIEVEQLKLIIDQKILPPVVKQFGVY